MRADGFDHGVRLLRDNDLVDAVGMDLDANNIEQIATVFNPRRLHAQLSGRSQVRTRVGSTLRQRACSRKAKRSTLILADLNHDGYDDLIVSTPHADLLTFIDNGRVDVYYGSATGLSTVPDIILAGDGDGSHFGAGMDVGDFNHDDTMDLAIGAPGWAPANDSELRHGQLSIFLGNASGLASSPWFTVTGANNESLGSAVEALSHSTSGDYLAATARNFSMSVSESQTDHGKVNIYAGNETGLSHVRNLTQTKAGDLFGRSLEGCDINNDGHEELIVGNTGSFQNTLSYSSVEYFYGSQTGYDGTPDHTLSSLTQGKLFGLSVACVGDLNGDGFDEHIITEPLNSTGVFGSGVLWLFDGTDQDLPGEADFQFEPTTPNTRVGEAVAAAGDINEDGYDDVYIASRMGSSAGRIEIFLGSSTGLSADRQLLAEGNSQRLGLRMASNGDVDGDGLGDLIYSLRSTSPG